MATKYHVVPDRYHTAVNLLYRPENDIDTTQSGQNRCCATDIQGRKTGTIFLLGPSAPIWKDALELRIGSDWELGVGRWEFRSQARA